MPFFTLEALDSFTGDFGILFTDSLITNPYVLPEIVLSSIWLKCL